MIGTALIAILGYGLAGFSIALGVAAWVNAVQREQRNTKPEVDSNNVTRVFAGCGFFLVALALAALTRWLLGGAV